MHLQVKNVVELTGSCFFTQKSELTFPSLPFDSFARLQFLNSEIDTQSLRSSALDINKGKVNYYESRISQSDMAIETFKLLGEQSNEDPSMMIHVSHFPNEDWFDFINMRLLKKMKKKCTSFSLVGLGSLGIPTALQHIIQNVVKEDMVIWVIVTDRIVSPYVRYIPNLGIISDSAIGVELHFADKIQFPTIDNVIVECTSVQSWYKQKNLSLKDTITLGKQEFYRGWSTFLQNPSENRIDFIDSSLGSAQVYLR